ncbi:AAA family ATPase [Rhodopseudomonas parapalustris]
MAKQIILKSLILHNFMGIKDMQIGFGSITNIFGENGTGKTTINDSFAWLLFDKDSHDNKNFDIKTLQSNGEPMHELNHEVIGALTVDGKQLTLQKTYREKWTKKRGEATKELTGHETLYYIDDVPVKKSEYQDKINDLLPEEIFKLITNPLYFASTIKWQDRRKVLLDIIGNVDTDRVINYNPSLKPLGSLLVDKDIDTLKRSIQARRKKLNDDIKQTQPRIDECNNAIKDYDFEALEIKKKEYEAEIKSVDDMLQDSSKISGERFKDNQRLYELKTQLQNIQNQSKQDAYKPLNDADVKISQFNTQIIKLESKKNMLEASMQATKDKISEKENRMKELRTQWTEEDKKELVIDENSFVCPTCNRPLDPDDIENKKAEMQKSFNINKAENKKIISTTGMGLNNQVTALKTELEGLQKQLVGLDEEIKVAQNSIAEQEAFKANYSITDYKLPPEAVEVSKQIAELETKLNKPVENNNGLQLKARKQTLQLELREVEKQLFCKEQNESLNKRIVELKEQEKVLAQQIAALEGQEYLCEEFIKTKVELLESSINAKFSYVKFKLFNTQVNGGVEECCEVLVNGVPYNSNLNSAARINGGIDIINTLCDHYNVQAPIFIDNRESVTKLIDTNSQVINLIVSEKDKVLRIESEVM